MVCIPRWVDGYNPVAVFAKRKTKLFPNRAIYTQSWEIHVCNTLLLYTSTAANTLSHVCTDLYAAVSTHAGTGMVTALDSGPVNIDRCILELWESKLGWKKSFTTEYIYSIHSRSSSGGSVAIIINGEMMVNLSLYGSLLYVTYLEPRNTPT